LSHQLGVLDKDLQTPTKIDIAIMQKLLPKLHGSRRKLSPILETLGSFCGPDKATIVKEVFEKDDFDFGGPNVGYPLSL
jgi:5-methylcytosine-specific restriction protein B